MFWCGSQTGESNAKITKENSKIVDLFYEWTELKIQKPNESKSSIFWVTVS